MSEKEHLYTLLVRGSAEEQARSHVRKDKSMRSSPSTDHRFAFDSNKHAEGVK